MWAFAEVHVDPVHVEMFTLWGSLDSGSSSSKGGLTLGLTRHFRSEGGDEQAAGQQG